MPTIIVARIPVTRTRLINPPNFFARSSPLNIPVAATSNANVAIIDASALFAASRDAGSRCANVISATVIIAIATVKSTSVDLQFLARCVTAINPANIASRTAITPTALQRPSGLMFLRTTITPVRINKEPAAINSIIPARWANCPARFETAISTPKMPRREIRIGVIRLRSSGDISAITLTTLTIVYIAVAKASIPIPPVAAFVPARFVIAINAAKIPSMPIIVRRFSAILFPSKLHKSSRALISTFKAMTIAIRPTPPENERPLRPCAAILSAKIRPTRVAKDRFRLSLSILLMLLSALAST